MSEKLKLGSRGADVKRVQQALNQLTSPTSAALASSKLPRLVEDGLFGAKTEARVKEFQARARLEPDGVVGPNTAKSLLAGALTSTFAVKRK